MTSPTWQWRPMPPPPATPLPPGTAPRKVPYEYFFYGPAGGLGTSRPERRVVLGTHDIGSFEYTFDGADLWASAGTPELRRALTRAVRRALPRELDVQVIASPGSLRLTVVAWLRAGWDRLTGRRQEHASGTATVDTVTFGQRLRAALEEIVRHPVDAIHRAAKVIQAGQLLKAAIDWIRDRLPDAITVVAGI